MNDSVSSSEICEWLWKEPVRSQRKSAEVYSKCSKWWRLTHAYAAGYNTDKWLCRSRSVEQMT